MGTPLKKLIMLLPKLKSIKKFKEEMDYWEKEISKAKKGDLLTETGLRQQNRLEQLEKNLIETKEEYDTLKADILTDEKYKNMDSELKKACDKYYFNGKTDMEINFPGENFLRAVRNYCHSLE